MDTVWSLIVAAGLLSIGPVLLRLRKFVCSTTLMAAWSWLAGAWVIRLAVWIATRFGDLTTTTNDLLWYGAAISMLVPPVAALGAKRPMSRAWPWFILLPLLLVFAWPVFSAVGRGWPPAAWNLEEPMLVGYGLVLLMGVGNYLGLRFTISALLWGAAACLTIAPVCPWSRRWLGDGQAAWSIGSLCLATGAWIGWWGAGANFESESCRSMVRLNRLWNDFREAFGIVWARRILERFNDAAVQSHLTLRLTIQEFVSGNGGPAIPDSQELTTAELTLRQLLRRFVDPEWIDARLTGDSGSVVGPECGERAAL